ncbi:MAG: transcriptional regulator GlxA family with amidase domain, partial [Flavobacteriaceae bacterium]
MIGSTEATTRICFYLVPNFSMLAFSSALEALRMANYNSGQKLYYWCLVSSDGESVTSSSGIPFPVSHSAQTREKYDAVFVCSGLNVHLIQDEPGTNWFKQLDKQGTVLGAICTGTYLLARAELLNDYRCTLHWENLAAAREEFPHLVISAE